MADSTTPDAGTPPAPAQSAYFLDASGKTRKIVAEDAAGAAELGWTPASPEQAKDFELQQKYGNSGVETAKAGVEGFLRGPTLGLSDKIETATGISTPEAIKAREKYNPALATVAELGGIGTAAVLTGGASAAAEGAGAAGAEAAGAGLRGAARFIPSNLVSSAGRAVEGAVAGSLPEGGSLASRLAANALSKAAGSAVEGAFYSAGHEVSEAALGDPDQTAQSVVAHIGLGTLLGGGLGGLIGAAEEGIPAAVTKAKEAVANVFKRGEDTLGNFYGSKLGQAATGVEGDTAQAMLGNKQAIASLEAKVPGIGGDLQGATPDMAKWAIENGDRIQEMEQAFPGTTRQILGTRNPETANYLLDNWQKIITDPKQRVDIAQNMTEGMQNLLDQAGKLSKRINTDLAPREAETLLQDANPVAASAAYDRVTDSANQAIEKMRAEPELFSQGYARKLESIRDGLTRDVDQSLNPVETFKRFQTLRQTLDDVIPYTKDPGALSLADRQAIDELKALRREVKANLVDEAVFGPAAARRASLDDAMSDWLTLTKRGGDFNKTFMTKKTLKGGVSYEVKPTKLNTWLNQMGDARGQTASEAWGRTMDAAKRLIDEAEASYKAAPVGEFDRAALDDLVNKTADITADARERAAVTQVKNQLDPRGHPWGSNAVATPGIGQALGMVGAVTHPLLAAPLAAAKVVLGARDVSKTVSTLAALERIGQKVGKAIDSGVSTLVRGGVKASYVARGEAAAGLGAFAAKTYAEQRKAYEKNTQDVLRLSGDMGAMQAAVSPSTEALAAHAPDTATALSMTQAAAIHFLASKVPQHPKKGPLGSVWVPTPAEMGKFQRYHEAVHDPVGLLKKAAAGKLMPEHVEALQTVYPKLNTQIQNALIHGMAKQKDVPYRSRLGLSLLLGQPVDGSTAPAAIRAHQATFNPPPGSKAQGMDATIRPTQGGASKITLSNRLLTPQQQSNNRPA